MPASILPAYLFLGEERFLKDEAIQKLKSRILTKDSFDLNYGVFYPKEKDFDVKEFLDCLNTAPFISKKRLVVLRDADSLSSQQKEVVINYLKNPGESSVLVVESPATSIKNAFLLDVSRMARPVYFRRLTDSRLENWISERAGTCGKKIDPDALKTLKDNLPNDLRAISENMDNLLIYTGKRTVISRQDVEKLVGVSSSHKAFDLINAVEARDTGVALRVFSSLTRDRKKETELLGLLAWNIRMILRVKGLSRTRNRTEIRKELGLNPRTFNNISSYASNFKSSRLLMLWKEIVKSDSEIKKGGHAAFILERLIVRMCS